METFNSAADMAERGFHLLDPPVNILNYDPAGDGDDNDAVVLVSREEWRRGELHDPDLAVEYLFRLLVAHRFPPSLEFPDKLAMLLAMNRNLKRWNNQGRTTNYVIGVEQNGVGYAMASSLRTKTDAMVIGYTTVGATSDKPFMEKHVSMPRLAALDNMRVLMELHRIKVAKDCPGKSDFKAELNAFVWKGPGRPEAMVGQKDDLVMAMAGALWIGTKMIPPVNKQLRIDPKRGIRSHMERAQGSIRLH